MKFTILIDNKTERADCRAEWGLAILIESQGEKILFDTGASAMFAENAKARGIDLADVDALVISHGHFDHTGGVEAFAAQNAHAPIYLHEEALYVTYGQTHGVMDDYNCGILWDDDLREKLRPRLRLTKGLQQISSRAWIAGNIPSMEDYPPTENFFRQLVSDPFIEPDPMNHEQCLIVEEDGRLHVFSGCSHKGVIPILTHVKRLFPDKKISGLVAGMHLYALPKEQRSRIIDRLEDFGLDYAAPLHCTGMDAIVDLKIKMGDRCKILTAGKTFSI